MFYHNNKNKTNTEVHPHYEKSPWAILDNGPFQLESEMFPIGSRLGCLQMVALFCEVLEILGGGT